MIRICEIVALSSLALVTGLLVALWREMHLLRVNRDVLFPRGKKYVLPPRRKL